MLPDTTPPAPFFDDGMVRVFHGDSREVLAGIPANSIDSVVTDPPYGLSKEPDAAEVLTHWLAGDDYVHTGSGFMGNSWDSFVPGPTVWREVLRVLKPGGHAVVFSSTRTFDLTVMALRLAGFEVRDTLVWNYAQGFPKNYDIGKNLAKAVGKTDAEADAAARDLAKRFAGWGTTLKPSHELIALVRKPPIGPMLANVAAHGVGGLNIDANRIRVTDAAYAANCSGDRGHADNRTRDMDFGMTAGSANTLGRYPANFLLSHTEFCLPTGSIRVKAPVINRFTDGAKPFGGGAGHAYESVQTGDAEGMEEVETFDCIAGCPVRELDEQSGILTSGAPGIKQKSAVNHSAAYGKESRPAGTQMSGHGDSGGASRFYTTFKYQAKAKGHERAVVWVPVCDCDGDPHDPATSPDVASYPAPRVCERCGIGTVEYKHPTVKPLGSGPDGLMGWLVRLITPVGGTTLDLYAGTGTTGLAARSLGFHSLLIERDPVHVGMIVKRLAEDLEPQQGNAKAGKTGRRLKAVPTATQQPHVESDTAAASEPNDTPPALFAI